MAGPDAVPAELRAALAEHYVLEGVLGEGGMSTVYLAHDVKHQRHVALKVLKPELAAALGHKRFLREISITARLNHPRFLPLLDSGNAGSALYYVMPYVTGESLRARLAREGALPVDDALAIARAVASALSYAHGEGFIHRDIKPENILLSGGEAVVADFGIARAVREASNAKLTETGLAVGTAAYMSPEQAAGDGQLDARSDIYSLACVLYEMLAGEPPHTGPTVQSVIAKVVIEVARPIDQLRPSVPAHVAAALAIALEKTPADRFATAAEFAAALAYADPTAVRRPAGARAGARAIASRGGWRAALPWAVAVAFLASFAAAMFVRRGASRTSPPAPLRFGFHPPPGDSIDFRSLAFRDDFGYRDVEISGDGRRVVFVGVHGADSTSRLYVRELGADETRPLAGTEGASAPFFSPDGEWIGFYDVLDGRLRKVPVRGGQSQVICECGPTSAADWGTDGWIVMDPGPRRNLTGLIKVRDGGGRPVMVPLTDSTFTEDLWGIAAPQFLPDGKTVLASLWGGGASRIVAISLETGRRTDIQPNAYLGRYVDPGYLLYAIDNELWAVRFDPDRLRTVGKPVRVIDSLLARYGLWAEYAISRSGTLVFHPAVHDAPGVRLTWVDRTGHFEPVAGVPVGGWMGARLSPDGNHIVYWGQPIDGTTSQTWLVDLQRGALRPLTDAAFTSAWPIFAPDGQHVVTNSNAGGGFHFPLYRMPLDGSAKPERLTTTPLMQQPSSWTPDGRTLAFQQGIDPVTKWDIYLVSLSGAHAVRPLLVTPASEREPAFSPNGAWLAYVSDESGRDEVYVRRYPALDAPVRVSVNGGEGPVWRADGGELFFATRSALFSAPAHDGRFGAPRLLFETRQSGTRNAFSPPGPPGRNFDVTPDGQRFLFWQLAAPIANGSEYHVIVHWLPEVEARLSAATMSAP